MSDSETESDLIRDQKKLCKTCERKKRRRTRHYWNIFIVISAGWYFVCFHLDGLFHENAIHNTGNGSVRTRKA